MPYQDADSSKEMEMDRLYSVEAAIKYCKEDTALEFTKNFKEEAGWNLPVGKVL